MYTKEVVTSAIECVANALDSLWIRLRSVGLEWSQWLKDHFDFYSLTTPRGELATILAATGFPSEIAPSVARSVKSSRRGVAVCNYYQERLAANDLRVPLEASVDEVVAASFAKDVVAQAKHSFITTFEFSRVRRLRRSRRKLLLTFLACKACSRLANSLFEYETHLGSKMRTGALGAF